jgi:peptidoglycan-associated lipoprotein
MRGVCIVFTGVALAFGAAACGGAKAKQVVAPTETAKPAEPIQATVQPASPNDGPPPPATPIYFDFDSYNIVDASKAELQQVSEYMQKHAGSTVTISGHTDERGTTEYNLMLGDQRAKAAHDYLVRLGIDPLRIKTISFGEERPAVPGHDEAAWSKNRRDEFNTTAPKQ